MKFLLYLCLELVLHELPFMQIKRESGENPGQSRCCETSFNTLICILLPLAHKRAGKVIRAEASQKTCHS